MELENYEEICLLIVGKGNIDDIDVIEEWVEQHLPYSTWFTDKGDELSNPTDPAYRELDEYKGFIYDPESNTFEERPIKEIHELEMDDNYFAIRDAVVPMTKKEYEDYLKMLEDSDE